jgi:hypothetical protein
MTIFYWDKISGRIATFFRESFENIFVVSFFHNGQFFSTTFDLDISISLLIYHEYYIFDIPTVFDR